MDPTNREIDQRDRAGPWRWLATATCLLAVSTLLWTAQPALADDDDDDDDKVSEFLEELDIRKARRHQRVWQRIADRNDGIRTAGTPGYDQSADYVERRLRRAGYEVEQQPFEFQTFRQTGPSNLEQTAPGLVTYVENTDYNLMSQSDGTDAAGVTGLVTGADLSLADPAASTSGCEAADFAGFPAGDIARVQRGACSFRLKAENAANAGAIGAIIFNQGNDPGRVGLINGTLSADYSGGIPVFFATFDRGVEWAGTEGLTMNMAADVFRGIVTTTNVIAELPARRGGDDDDDDDGGPSSADAPVIVVGAHLDSVPQGAGIQDNGSGSAAILEIALQLADEEISTRNRIRFAWWGAEEFGLVGSTFYVANLPQEELDLIEANVNLDMIGSPNFVRFIYDGDNSANLPGSALGPPGSDVIEQLFVDHFEARGLETEPTAFSGRSDYGPFIAAGVDIPAGGLFTGAEVLKPPEQVEIYGGIAGEQYDQCYHLACDTFDNINLEVFEQNLLAAGDVILTLADMDMPLAAPAPVTALRTFSAEATARSENVMEYLGDKLQR